MGSAVSSKQSWDYFLSFAKEEKARCEELADQLEQQGRKVFVADRVIELGTPWLPQLTRALRSARVVVVLLSSHSGGAHYQREEIELALHLARRNRLKLVPVYLDGPPEELEDWELGLRGYQNIDLRQDGVVLAAERLGRLLGASEAEPVGVGEAQTVLEAGPPVGPVRGPTESGASLDAKTALWRRPMLGAVVAGLVALVLLVVLAAGPIARFFTQESPDSAGTRPDNVGDEASQRESDAPTESDSPAETHDSTRPTMITLEGGSFQMGSENGDDDERPIHRVEIVSFQISKTEITVAQYRACVEAKGCAVPEAVERQLCNWGKEDREDHPINCVSWGEARTYAEWLDARLPSEAEWEYAARSQGLARAYPWGDEEASCERAVISDCGRSGTSPVCTKTAGNTEQGLCDMAGNVWEWVEDDSHRSYEGAPEDGSAWIDKPRAASRVLRGGSWRRDPRYARVADRDRYDPSGRFDYVGFRVARSLPSAL